MLVKPLASRRVKGLSGHGNMRGDVFQARGKMRDLVGKVDELELTNELLLQRLVSVSLS